MRLQLVIGDEVRQVEIEPGVDGHWCISIEGNPIEADACLLRPGVLSLLIEGRSWRVVLDGHSAEPAFHIGPERLSFRVEDPRSLRLRRRSGAAHGPVTLRASMPGRVVRLLIEVGERVAAHQGVLVVEAMKMQNELQSPKEGRVTQIRVSPGDTVASGEVLVVIE